MPTLEFLDAGHTLGSAGVMVRGAKESLLYSGDVCFHDQTILRAADFGDARADTLILETTRGARAAVPGVTRETEIERLREAVSGTLKRKGSVLIPAFGLGRTQEILAQIALWMAQGKLKRQPVYIGGLGKVFSEIYDIESHRANRNHRNLKLTEALDLRVLSVNQVPGLRLATPHLFVLTSGMMNENTAAHDLAARMAQDERHGIYFVGYADPDTPGGRLKESKVGKRFLFSDGAGDLKRRCSMDDFDLSAHARALARLHHLLAIGLEVIRHGQQAQLRGCEPEWEVTRGRLGQYSEEALHRAKDRAVHHDRLLHLAR
jgi:predicted metal-dependent RNase